MKYHYRFAKEKCKRSVNISNSAVAFVKKISKIFIEKSISAKTL